MPRRAPRFPIPLPRGAVKLLVVLNVAVADVRAEVGDALVVMADLCLDEFTDHGHCGVLTPAGEVDVIDEQPEAGRIVLAGDTLDIAPGVTLALPGRDPVRVGQPC